MATAWRMALMAAMVCGAAAPAAAGYDANWYEAPFWPGEYANGFTMTADASTAIRSEPDPEAPRSMDCRLRAGATYHPWNLDRVETDQLEFRSYSPIARYRVVTPVSTVAYAEDDAEVTLDLRPGQEWDYLTYLAEGMFLLQLDGEAYTVGQEVVEASEAAAPASEADASPHEWLKLTCANGVRGWLLLSDVEGEPAFGPPYITDYGSAADRR